MSIVLIRVSNVFASQFLHETKMISQNHTFLLSTENSQLT